MALRDARVSLVWINRVSAGMSGARVKRVVEGGLGVSFFMVVAPTLFKEPPPPAVKQDWVAAVRGLTDRKCRKPAHPKMPHAQPP